MKNKKIALILTIILTTSTTAVYAETITNNKQQETTINLKETKGHKELPSKKGISNNKDFQIRFNKEIDFNTVNKNNIKITDKTGEIVPITFKIKKGNNKVLLIEAPKKGYKYGESYTLNINEGIKTKDNKNLKDKVIMNFTVKKDEVEFSKVLNDYMDGHNFFRQGNEFTESFKNEVYYKNKGYMKVRKDFNEKYMNNPKYEHITDINYFTKLPGSKIKFDKVNMSNLVPYYAPYDFSGSDVTKEICLQPIWRLDIEEDMVKEINKLRKEKGLAPVEVDPNLTAIAKYGCKANYVLNGLNRYETTDTYDTGFDVSLDSMKDSKRYFTGFYGKWSTGIMFLPKEFQQYEKDVDLPDEYRYMENFFSGNAYKIEDSLDKYFDYAKGKKVYAVADANEVASTAKGFIEKWKIDDWDIENYYVPDQGIQGVPVCGIKKIGIIDYRLKNLILNPNVKKIGVGSLYRIPECAQLVNGLTGIYMIGTN